MKTKQQQAIEKIEKFIIGKPFTPADFLQLCKILQNTDHDSVWGDAIKTVFTKELENLTVLIDQLSDQAVDDPMVMIRIVGFDGTALLIRYNKK